MPIDVSRPSTFSTSSSLLKRVQQQDPESWCRFVNLYGPLLYRWCRRWGISADDAPDVVQDVALRVARAIGDFQHQSAGSFRGWLWTIARNKAYDYFARLRREPRAAGGTDQQLQIQDIPEDYPTDEEAVADSICLLRLAVDAVSGDFQERTWQIFWRLAVEGDDTANIAREFKMTRRAVRQAKHRVVKRLREEFEGLIDD